MAADSPDDGAPPFVSESESPAFEAHAFVLAGGRSSRMGQDKAMVLYHGRPLIEHALASLRSLRLTPAIAGDRADLAGYAAVVPDLHPGCGPLGGIEAALEFVLAEGIADKASNRLSDRVPDAPVLFLAVDLPLLPVAVIAAMLERSQLTGALVTLPTIGGRPQPLCAVYRSAILPAVQAALTAGNYRVLQALEAAAPGQLSDIFSIEALAATCPGWPREVPVHRWFANVNTPAELASLA